MLSEGTVYIYIMCVWTLLTTLYVHSCLRVCLSSVCGLECTRVCVRAHMLNLCPLSVRCTGWLCAAARTLSPSASVTSWQNSSKTLSLEPTQRDPGHHHHHALDTQHTETSVSTPLTPSTSFPPTPRSWGCQEQRINEKEKYLHKGKKSSRCHLHDCPIIDIYYYCQDYNSDSYYYYCLLSSALQFLFFFCVYLWT